MINTTRYSYQGDPEGRDQEKKCDPWVVAMETGSLFFFLEHMGSFSSPEFYFPCTLQYRIFTDSFFSGSADSRKG